MPQKKSNVRLTRKEIAKLDFSHISLNVVSIVDDLRNSNIFISGATGFFGRSLVESLIELDFIYQLQLNLFLLVRDISNFQSIFPNISRLPNVNVLEGDINNLSLPFIDISHAIHAAATSRIWVSPAQSMKTIIDGTDNILEWLGKCNVRRVLFISSGAVYGQLPIELNSFSEKFIGAPDTLSPNSAYGEAKRCAELKCAIASDKYGFDFSIARCFSFIGPYLPWETHFAAGNLINDAINQNVLNIKGDGSALRSYLYAADLVIWLLTILCRAPTSRAYNVGSDEIISILHLAETIKDIAGRNLRINILGNENLDLARSIYLPDISRAKQELDLSPKISLNDGITRMLNWHQNIEDDL